MELCYGVNRKYIIACTYLSTKKKFVQGSNCYGINPARRIILHGRYDDMGHRKRNA